MRISVPFVSLMTTAALVLAPSPSFATDSDIDECLKAAGELAGFQNNNQMQPVSDKEAQALTAKLQDECTNGQENSIAVAKRHRETLADFRTMLPNYALLDKFLEESMRATCANLVAFVFAYQDSRSEFKNTQEKSSFLIQAKKDCAYSRDPQTVMDGYTKYYVRSLAISNAEISTDEADRSDEWRRELMEKFTQNHDTFYFACVATVAETNKLTWTTQRDIKACADDVSGVWREAAQEVGFDKWLENRTPKPLPEKAYTATSSKGQAPTM